jgi:hypothetical protein
VFGSTTCQLVIITVVDAHITIKTLHTITENGMSTKVKRVEVRVLRARAFLPLALPPLGRLSGLLRIGVPAAGRRDW